MTQCTDSAFRPGNTIALGDGRTLGYADYGGSHRNTWP